MRLTGKHPPRPRDAELVNLRPNATSLVEQFSRRYWWRSDGASKTTRLAGLRGYVSSFMETVRFAQCYRQAFGIPCGGPVRWLAFVNGSRDFLHQIDAQRKLGLLFCRRSRLLRWRRRTRSWTYPLDLCINTTGSAQLQSHGDEGGDTDIRTNCTDEAFRQSLKSPAREPPDTTKYFLHRG